MRDCVLGITPLKSARHSEVGNFLYSFINELTVGVSPAPASVYLLETVMNALRAEILKDEVEVEIVDARIKRELVKYLVVVSN